SGPWTKLPWKLQSNDMSKPANLPERRCLSGETARQGSYASGCATWKRRGRLSGIRSSASRRCRKPVTSALALMLFEEGRFALSDPVTRWAPELSKMQVLRTPDGPLDETEPAERPITFEDLLTHRSGLTYGEFHRGPIAAAYTQALGGDIDSDVQPPEWIARLAALPLIDQPGRQFHYGKSTDLLGLLIERMEDAPLADVLKRRIFDPLGMKDTGFTVAEKIRAACGSAWFRCRRPPRDPSIRSRRTCTSRTAQEHDFRLRRP